MRRISPHSLSASQGARPIDRIPYGRGAAISWHCGIYPLVRLWNSDEVNNSDGGANFSIWLARTNSLAI
jgi:hypothetical protein